MYNINLNIIKILIPSYSVRNELKLEFFNFYSMEDIIILVILGRKKVKRNKIWKLI